MVKTLKFYCRMFRRSIPSTLDSVWPTMPLRMKHNPAAVPASYPTQKLPILDNPALFEKLDSEALFFAFYYQPGSLQQYLAARELKRQSWRYHKQHGAWFQVSPRPMHEIKWRRCQRRHMSNVQYLSSRIWGLG